jgi:hypothetical protein
LSSFSGEFKKRILKYSVWNQAKGVSGQSSTWTLVGLTVVSVAVHGLVLGLPMPGADEAEVSFLPESGSETSTVMDVAILPKRDLAPTVVEPPAEPKSKLDETVRPAAPASTSVPEIANPPRLPAEPLPSVADSPPAVPPVDESGAESGAEPTSPSELPPDPLAELPPEPGTRDLSEPEPPPPPTLAEQLQDPSAYQYDGRKSLDQLTATTESMSWAVEGQALPSKVDPMELPYQLAAHCLDTPPAMGLLMVVVDAEGNFLRGPEVISSTGYRVLDEQAVEQVKNGDYALPDRTAPKAYSVEVKVQYPESCP